jgi:hypothetical protein
MGLYGYQPTLFFADDHSKIGRSYFLTSQYFSGTTEGFEQNNQPFFWGKPWVLPVTFHEKINPLISFSVEGMDHVDLPRGDPLGMVLLLCSETPGTRYQERTFFVTRPGKLT